MTLFVDVFAVFDIILIAIMLSGSIVKMGTAHGTIRGDYHFKGFYLLFLAFILENIVITVFANYVFLPFLEKMLPNSFFKVLALTGSLVCLCNIWFASTFRFNQRKEVIVLTVIMAIITVLLFVYT
ncbi:MAG: hypothetical protein ABSG33_02445 [Candidatus Bathyarchaeia archaeon]|jgi:hypothetical protein